MTSSSKKIQLQVTVKNLRVRKRNEFETLILDGNLKKIDTTQTKRDQLLRREIKSIQQELDKIEVLYSRLALKQPTNENEDKKPAKTVKSAPHKLQTRPSARATAYREMVQSKATSYKSLPARLGAPAATESDGSEADDCDNSKVEAGHTCRYNPDSPRCTYFPCTLPPKYHSIGYRLPSCKLNRRSAVKTRGTMGVPKAWDDFFDTENESHYNSLTRPLRSTSSERTHVRERALNKIVSEMRKKNSKKEPTDWNINYGKPVPRRRVLKPPKVVSLGAGVYLD